MTPLVVLTLAFAVGYLAACWVWPFAACGARKCQGGRVRSPSGKAWRLCRRCKGKGSHVRWGRRLYEVVTGRRTHT